MLKEIFSWDTPILFIIGFVVSFMVLFICTRIFGVPSETSGLYRFATHPISFSGIMGIMGMYTALKVFGYLFIK